MNSQSISPHTVRIFISSPGDVAEERERARQVIEGLRRRYAGRLVLQPILWEDLPLQADTAFQEGIDSVLTDNREVSIAVFILWSRLGSALGPRIRKADGSEYRSGTEREFDLMMQARRQSRGARPAILAYIRQDLASFEERLRGKPQDERNELLAQMNLLKSFVQESFQDQESGHNIGAYHSFDRPVSFSQRLRTHLVALLDELAGDTDQASWDVTALGPPFLGLQSFQPEHADIFFGREEETQEARFALGEQAKRGCAFLIITGASGSGKSSLARAGVLPEILNNEKDEQVTEWRSMILTPAELSPRPVHEFVNRLAQPDLLPELAPNRAEVASQLCEDPTQTVAHLLRPKFHRLAGNTGGQVRLLLVLDQLEEIFAAHVMTAEDRKSFLKLLEALARSGFVWVLATARSDFYHQIQEEPVLARLLEGRGPMPLLPPKPDALQRLIEEPARLAGLRFEQDEQGVSLAGRILTDASNHAEMLPLVEFVLRELFDQRAPDGTMSRAVYVKLGGVEGAVGQKAEETFQSLPLESQAAFTEILPRLVSLETDGGESAVRRWAPLADLQASPARKQLTDALIAGRFFTADQQGNAPVAGFSHEALLRCWPRITQWIAANREFLRMRSRVEQQQQRWEQQGSDTSLLLPPGLPLEEGRTLLTGARHVLSESSAAFIQTSLDHAAAQEAKARRRRRAVMAVMGALTCVAMGGGLFAWNKQQEAVEAEKHAVAEQDKSREAELDAQKERKESRKLLGVNQLQHGVSEYDAGRTETAFRDLYLAQINADGPLRDSIRRVLADRIMHGGRSPGLVMRHSDEPFTDVAFSPDGSRIVTGSEDGSARIWDGKIGTPLGKPMWNEGVVTSVAFSPDGTRIVTGAMYRSEYGSARIWGGQTGAPLCEPILHGGEIISSVAFSPDGTRIVTASNDQTARMWDGQTGAPIGEPMKHEGGVSSVAFSPDGTRIISGSHDNTARIWDAQAGTSRGEPMKHEGSVTRVVFSPDGTRIATVSLDKTARIWDGQTGTPLGQPMRHEQRISSLAFSPDGTRIVTGSDDNTARIWDAQTGTPRSEPMRHDNVVSSVAFSPDGTCIVTGSGDKTARIWDGQTGIERGEPMRHENGVDSVAFSPDGASIVCIAKNAARIWDVAYTLTPLGEPIRHEGSVTSVAFSPDGSRIVTGSHDKTARIWDAQTRAPLGNPMRHELAVTSVAFSPDGTRIVTGSDDMTARIWDAQTGTPLGEPMRHEDRVTSVAFSLDGTRIVTGAEDGTTQIWDAELSAPLGKPKRHGKAVMSVAFSPDGHSIVTGSEDGTARITWLGDRLGEPMRHEKPVISVAFSRDGARIVTGSDDKTARIWDAKTGIPVGEPMRHEGRVTSVAFSPDGTRIVTGSDDMTARIWDTQTSIPLGEPMRHQARVLSVAFSPEDTQIVTGSANGTALIWDARERPLPFGIFDHQTGLMSVSEGTTRPMTSEEIRLDGDQLFSDKAWLEKLARYHEQRARNYPKKP